MSKYASRIFLDPKNKDAAAKAEAIEDAQNEVTNAIFAAKKVVRDYEKVLAKADCRVPFKPELVIEAGRDLKDATEDLASLEAMQTAMF